jgi:hypothetical protein
LSPALHAGEGLEELSVDQPYTDLRGNPHGYCPNHATGMKLPDDFVVTPLQDVD